MTEEESVQHYALDTAVDIPNALEATAIEHLDVDDHRIVVIYQRAILIVRATEGHIAAAQAVDVELWEPPTEGFDRDPADLLTTFIDELIARTDASRK